MKFLKEKNQFRSSFAYFSFKKSRLITATVVARGAIRTAAAVVTAAETAVRAEEQEREDYDPEALVVLE